MVTLGSPITDLASSVLSGTTVTEEGPVLGVTDIVVFVADLGADGTHPDAVHHLTGVAVVPVLVHELLLGDGERAQLVVEGLLILLVKGTASFKMCEIDPSQVKETSFTCSLVINKYKKAACIFRMFERSCL